MSEEAGKVERDRGVHRREGWLGTKTTETEGVLRFILLS